MRCAFAVSGQPVTQGSMVAVYNRRTGRAAVRHQTNLPLMRWRTKIGDAAKAAGAYPTHNPVTISIVFGMMRPRLHYGIEGTIKPQYQSAIPQYRDIDKLIRSVLDALTGIAYIDDRQVCDLHAIRVYGTKTQIEVRDIESEDAAWMVRNTETGIGEGQLPLLLLRQKSE